MTGARAPAPPGTRPGRRAAAAVPGAPAAPSAPVAALAPPEVLAPRCGIVDLGLLRARLAATLQATCQAAGAVADAPPSVDLTLHMELPSSPSTAHPLGRVCVSKAEEAKRVLAEQGRRLQEAEERAERAEEQEALVQERLQAQETVMQAQLDAVERARKQLETELRSVEGGLRHAELNLEMERRDAGFVREAFEAAWRESDGNAAMCRLGDQVKKRGRNWWTCGMYGHYQYSSFCPKR